MQKKTNLTRRRGRRRPRVPSVNQIFTQIELADIAIKKLFLDEPLTDEELQALFASEYILSSDSSVNGTPSCVPQTLYKADLLGVALTSPILFSNIEREMLAYFGRHPELLYSLPPRKFEELVAAVFRNNGFQVELTPETRDGGVDIFAVQKSGFGGSTLHLVECKRYASDNKVGIGILQRLLGVVEHHRATKGVIVTTSSFSSDAEIFAEQSRYRLGLGTYTDLCEWLKDFANKP